LEGNWGEEDEIDIDADAMLGDEELKGETFEMEQSS